MSEDAKDILSDSIREKPKTPQIERLFGKSCEINHIETNDVIPIGGNMFSDELTTGVNADFEHFSPLIQQAVDQAGKYNLVELKKWLESTSIDIDEQLFAKLYAFTQVLEQKYPITPNLNSTRAALYAQAQGDHVKLSKIFETGNAECAEIALLAQYYLQEESVPSSFFNGEVLWNKDSEFAEPHSFIVIRNAENQYIYDPANPVDTTQGKFPSIYTVNVDFDQQVRLNQKRYVTSTNIISKRSAYYGVGNGTNVAPENII